MLVTGNEYNYDEHNIEEGFVEGYYLDSHYLDEHYLNGDLLPGDDAFPIVSESVQSIIENPENIVHETHVLINYLQNQIPALIGFGFRVIFAFILFLLGRLVIRGVCKLLNRYLTRIATAPGAAHFLGSFVKIALYIILVLIIAVNIGVAPSSVAALLGSMGLAIGLALQGSLANFAGGIMILLLKPFVVGDYILVHNGGSEGTVKEVSVFYTKLSTVDNKIVIIPNGMLTSGSLTNVTERPERQLDIRVSVSGKADLNTVKSLLKEIAENTPAIIKEEGINVFVDELRGGAVVFGVRGWVKTVDYTNSRCNILEDIKIAFDKSGIDMV